MAESKKKRILIVEDDPPLRQALVDEFIRNDFLILEAKDGEEGLAMALKEHPDMILLDLAMPKMNGNEMFDKLCKDEWGMRVPVIFLTNITDSKVIVESVREGVSDYLVKSEYKIKDVVEKVKERLGM